MPDYFPEGAAGMLGYDEDFMSVGCRYRVNVKGKNVQIFEEEKEEDEDFTIWSIFSWEFLGYGKKIPRQEMSTKNTNYNILVKEFKNVKKVFLSIDEVGFDPGNHILINISDDKYVSIGDYIFGFRTQGDKILNLFSPTDDDFKFAYAVGKKNTYLLTHRSGKYITCLSNKYLKEIGFLTQKGDSFNWKDDDPNSFPNFSIWNFDKDPASRKIKIKIILE